MDDFNLFDGDFATWVNVPELAMRIAIWITTVVLDEGLNKVTNISIMIIILLSISSTKEFVKSVP